MKKKFLKLNKPCSEQWDTMTPNEKGNYCSVCSKTVVDFTKLSTLEISEKIKASNGSTCAKLTQQQLNTPIFDIEAKKEIHFPYANIAASLLLATTLTAGQTVHAKNTHVQTEFRQTTLSTLGKTERKQLNSKPNNPKPNSCKNFIGIVTSEKTGQPIENAKIEYITVQKIFTVYTANDGTFSMEIASELIDNDNVIRVSYDDIKNRDEKDARHGYERADYILSREAIYTCYQIKAIPMVLILGGILGYNPDGSDPIVINNGQKVKFKDFVRAQQGKKSSCSIENKDYRYFEPNIAVAIYGEDAKYGLYMLTDKVEK